jgi:hypothetical protein
MSKQETIQFREESVTVHFDYLPGCPGDRTTAPTHPQYYIESVIWHTGDGDVEILPILSADCEQEILDLLS